VSQSGYIAVNLDLLGTLAADLSTLYRDIDGVTATMDSVQYWIGSTVVEAALDEFAANWAIRRGRLLESIDAVQTMVADSHSTFTEVDIELANQLLGEA
jgi:hypothetical protein